MLANLFAPFQTNVVGSGQTAQLPVGDVESMLTWGTQEHAAEIQGLSLVPPSRTDKLS